VEVRSDPDGGVTIFIPPTSSDRLRRVTWIVPLFVLAQAGLCIMWGPGTRLLGEAWPSVLFVIVVAGAWLAAKGWIRATRFRAPTVIGVDREFLYADFPDRFRRRRRWPRRLVRDVQIVNVKSDGRGQKPGHWVQIVFTDYTPPIELCPHHTDADRQRLAAVLRAALELPGKG
jgi:hypothetical protein